MKSWLFALLLVIVTECNGTPIHDAFVEIYRGATLVASGVTDEEGIFITDEEGNLTVVVNKLSKPVEGESDEVVFRSCFVNIPLVCK